MTLRKQSRFNDLYCLFVSLMFAPDELIFGRPSALLQLYLCSIHKLMRILAHRLFAAGVKTASMPKLGERKRLVVATNGAIWLVEVSVSAFLA